MAREENVLPTIYFQRYTARFAEIDWSKFLGSAFDLNTILQGMEQEAGQKGCVIVVQVALVPAEDFRAEDEGEEPAESESGEPDAEEGF